MTLLDDDRVPQPPSWQCPHCDEYVHRDQAAKHLDDHRKAGPVATDTPLFVLKARIAAFHRRHPTFLTSPIRT